MSTPTDDEPTTAALIAAVQDLALAAGHTPAVVSVYGDLMLTAVVLYDDRDTSREDSTADAVLEAADRELPFPYRAEMGRWIDANWSRLVDAANVLDALRDAVPNLLPDPVPGASAYRAAGEWLALDAGESTAAVAWAGAVAEARWIRLMTGREVGWDELTASNPVARAAGRWMPEPERDRLRDWIFESWDRVDDLATASI